MAKDERHEAAQIVRSEAVSPNGFGKDLLDHEDVDVDERELDQVQGEHANLLVVMGWQDCHLHEFEIGGQRYGVPDTDYNLPREVVKDSTVKLSSALPGKGASLLYSYDFGDNWAHSVILEDIVLIEPATHYPRVVDGARACPPEDSGGPYGYADLVEILAKPRHKEHREMREWAGKNFDPEKFSAKAANLLLKQTLPKSLKLRTPQVQ